MFFLQNPCSSKLTVWTISRPFKSICSNFCMQWYPQWKSKWFFYIRSLLKWTNRSKNGHSGALKTNRLQSGFRDLKKKIQTEQTVNRKKSGFRAGCRPSFLDNFIYVFAYLGTLPILDIFLNLANLITDLM